MTVVAQIDHSQNPAVVQTVVDYGDDEIPQEIRDAQQDTPPGWVDVTNANPRPGPQWTFDGTNFTQPPVQVNQRNITNKAQQALASNATYLGVANPNNAQIAAQVASLTKQMNALIRMQLGQFDSTAGT